MTASVVYVPKKSSTIKGIVPQGIFDWKDITVSQEELKTIGVRYSEALKILHVRQADGSIHQGVDAFMILWKELKYWRILGFFVGLPGIKQLANAMYQLFAAWRFKRLAHCQLAAHQDKEAIRRRAGS